jgi:phosphate transport system substrate-binding protein
VRTLVAKNKIIAVIAVLVIVVAGVAVYTVTNNNNDKNDDVTITINGSTTVGPIMSVVQEQYESEYSNVTLNISTPGSGAGAAAAIAGTADIAMLSRDLNASEISSGLVSYTIGKDGIAIIVNKDVGITNLTLEQVAEIYSGQITNWSEVGGVNQEINLIGRESSSGTRTAFEEFMVKAESTFVVSSSMIELASNNALLTAVESTDYAIGYVSLGIALESGSTSITILDINGVHATIANVINGTYSLQRNLILATMGEAKGDSLALINWILSAKGQAIVEEEGYISINS